MNISHFRFILFNLKIFGEIVTTFFFFGPHLVSGKKTLQLRGRNYLISTEVWSRLQKRPPMQNFTI